MKLSIIFRDFVPIITFQKNSESKNWPGHQFSKLWLFIWISVIFNFILLVRTKASKKVGDFYHPNQNFCEFAKSRLWLIWYINIEGNTDSYRNINWFISIDSKPEMCTINLLKQWKLSGISDSGIHHRTWSLHIH